MNTISCYAWGQKPLWHEILLFYWVDEKLQPQEMLVSRHSANPKFSLITGDRHKVELRGPGNYTVNWKAPGGVQ